MKQISGLQLHGMILVAVPLLFQLLFAAAATGLLIRLNGETQRELNSQDVVRQAFSLSRESITDIVSGNITRRAGTPIHTADARARIESSMKEMDAFCAMLQSRPNQKENAILLRKGCHQLKKIILAEVNPDAFASDVERVLHQARLMTVAPRVAERLLTAINIEEKEGKQHLADSQQSVDQLIAMSVAGVVVSLFVAIALSFYYARLIRRPLQHLCENGYLLSKRQKLLPPLEARDEFSKLDRLLHSVADYVTTALAREQSIVDNAGDMICSLDASGNLCSINIGGERLLGYTKDSLLSSKLDSLTVPEHVDLVRDCLKKCVNSKESQRFELRLVTAEGHAIDTLWSILWSPVHELLFCVVHNVTEQKKAQRLRDDFTKMISSDLRQPLIAINDSLNVISSGRLGDVSEATAKDVSVAERNVTRLIDMVDDLLDFQQLSAGVIPLEMGDFDLVEVSKDAASLVHSLAQDKGVNLVLPSGSLVMHCDGKKVMQALINLISNAIKYSPGGGAVTVDLIETNASIQLRVTDQGPGVPDDFKQSIFEPFQQAPSAKGKVGTGLGLAICKSIAEVHGGSISVIDGAEGGSVFCMELPKRMLED